MIAIATKSARPRRQAAASTFYPLFAVELTIDGKRRVVSDVTGRQEALATARELNRDTPRSGYRARVRPVVVRYAD